MILLQPMLFSAEGMGFEPMPPVTVLNAFQAFLLNHLSNLPSRYSIKKEASRLFALSTRLFCAFSWARTKDPLINSQML